MTAYTRAPAQGRWRAQGQTVTNDVIAVEVIVEDIDEEWWRGFRRGLEARFRQRHMIVQAHEVQLL